ncbi:MAG: hypothetical protein ABIK09_03235 [Pseudomonadota bacterium]
MQRLTATLVLTAVLVWGCGGSGTTVSTPEVLPGDAEVVDGEIQVDGCCLGDGSDALPEDGVFEDTDATEILVDAPPIPCEVQGDCPDGMACLDTGLCGPCETAGDCGQGEGCSVDGACGACTSGEDCLDGDGCNGDGECGPCSLTKHCPEGQACVETVCQACDFSTQCFGGLCVEGACVDCTPGDDDALCAEEYAKPGYACLEDGTCGVVTCDTSEDCYPLHLACVEGVCDACDPDAQNCDPDVFGPEAQCVEGYCVAECLTAEQCFDDKPVCGDDGLCRECNKNAECGDFVDAGDLPAGQQALCTPTGQCVPGNCYDVEKTLSCLDGNKGLCVAHVCEPCVEPDDDEDCIQQYGDNKLCIEGECVDAECHALGIDDPNQCAGGKAICDEGHECVPCTTYQDPDQVCVDTYAQEAGEEWICVDDICQPWVCDPDKTSDYCVAGQVCVEDAGAYVCVLCADPDDDSLCIQQYGDDFLCVDGDCVVADCHETSDCPDKKICDDEHLCQVCSTWGEPDQACLEAWGLVDGGDDWLCADGVCQPWQCVGGQGVTDLYCPQGQLCGTDHFCAGCTEPADDQKCKTQFGESFLCIAGACIVGACHDLSVKDPNECSVGETICTEDHVCATCDTFPLADLACEESYGAANPEEPDWLCSSQGKCKPWQCEVVDDCLNGQICNNQHKCVPCVEPTDDPYCEAQYGNDHICAAGACTPGVCHPLAIQDPNECSAAKEICSDDNLCLSCELSPQPSQACFDTYHPYEGGDHWLCWNDKCQPWECAIATHCVNGMICSNDHGCEQCDPDAGNEDCLDAYAPVTKLCVFDEDAQMHLCKDPCEPGACSDGKICDPQIQECVACQDWVDDALCDNQYASNRLCIGGACTVANCHGDDSVPAGVYECVDGGKVCDPVTHFCSFCSAQLPCPTYVDPSGSGYAYLCDSGTCNLGTCCDGDGCLETINCSENMPCDGYVCGCDEDTDCWNGLQLDGCLDPTKMDTLNFCIGGACRAPQPSDIEAGKCAIPFVSGEGMVYKCYDAAEHKSLNPNENPKEGCLLCNPYTAQGGHKMAWTPGTMNDAFTFQATHCYIDDPDDGPSGEGYSYCRPLGPALEDEVAKPTVPSWECKACVPEVSALGREDMFRWRPPVDEPESPGALEERTLCSQPRYYGTFDNPIPEGQGDYPYSGSTTGRCWQTRCRGMAWQPWLPLGMAGAGGVYTTADTGAGFALVGSFGGGFGAGVPTLVNEVGNPGCDCVDDGDCDGTLACVGCRCTCGADSDCGGYCLYGSCVEGCKSDADCAPAAPVCVNGQCFECDGPEVCADDESCEIGVCSL